MAQIDQAANLRNLVKQDEATAPLQQERARVITVVSGKGGTGKTFFSVNFALRLAEIGKKVLVIDADFGLSNVDVLLGTKPKYSLGDVLRGEVQLEEAVCTGHYGIRYISGGTGDEALLNLKKGKLNTLYQQIKDSPLTQDLDFLLFDCSAGIDPLVLHLLSSSDSGLLVMTTEPTSLMDAFVLVKSIAAKKRKPPIQFVMNRADGFLEATVVARNFKNIVEKYVSYDLRYLGYVSSDKHVAQSVKMQVPLMLSFPNCEAAKNIKTLVSQQTETEKKTNGGGIRRFFERMIASDE
ncbi:MAG: AAA family ATPase [Eubacteriales bacterium]|nr:AAA family ATPase [Eubacteriales bacterium]